jgi:hypothetical protein
MKQNIIIDTIDGKVKLQFEHCIKCKYHDSCYKLDGKYHKRVPLFITQECVDIGLWEKEKKHEFGTN